LVAVRGRAVRGDGLRLLLLPPPPSLPRRARLRRREVVGERGGELLDRAQPLTRVVEQLRRARRVGIGRGDKRGADRERHLEGGAHELRRVLLVPVAAGVRERAEEPLRVRVLLRRLAIERLADGAREAPRPAREDLLRRVRLAVRDRAKKRPHAGG